MSTRKRQRPSARDFFDYQPSQPTRRQPAQPSALVLECQEPQVNPGNLAEYYSDLVNLDPFERLSELARGRTKLDALQTFPKDGLLFVVKSKDCHHRFPNPIDHTLEPSHIARLLWGPGKREVNHGKAIHLGHLHFSADEGQALTTEHVYAIQFSNQRSADMAVPTIEFRLNQFFLSQNHSLLVQVTTGSPRWFIKDQDKSLDEAGWKIAKKKIAYLRPLPTLKSHPTSSPDNNAQNLKVPERIDKSLAFEVAQLPKPITIPTLLLNLLKLEWLELPIEIKLTEETTTDLPIRILLKFSNPIPAKICKLSLFHHGISAQPDQQNTDDKKIVQFIIDEGDSSIDDTWNIWKTGVVWNQQTIGDFIKTNESNKKQEEDEEVDQLDSEEDKHDGFGSDEFDEWVSSHPTADATNKARRPVRTRQTVSFQQRLDANEKEWEKELERLTILADEEYLNNQDPTKTQASKSNSGYYQVSQRVLEDKQFHNLMDLIKRKSRRRKLTKEYRKVKPLCKKIKRQRRAWRSGGSEPNESHDADTEDEEEEEEPQLDEPDAHQRASFTEQDWKKFRHKSRSKRLLDPISSGDDNDDELVSKSLLTNDQVYQRKFARRNEPAPGDVK